MAQDVHKVKNLDTEALVVFAVFLFLFHSKTVI
jgi:hypothetical protein